MIIQASCGHPVSNSNSLTFLVSRDSRGTFTSASYCPKCAAMKAGSEFFSSTSDQIEHRVQFDQGCALD